MPWKCGKLLTCPDTFAPSHICQTTTAADGEVATHTEERKCSKYSSLPVTHDFIPVAIETSGVMWPQSLHSLRELGRRVGRQTGDPLAPSHLFQRLSTEETLLPSCAIFYIIVMFMCFTVIVKIMTYSLLSKLVAL